MQVGDGLLGERGVTTREAEVLELVAHRMTNQEIAAALYVSKRTVESHVAALMRKLAVNNRHALADIAHEIDQRRDAFQVKLPAALEIAVESTPLVGRDKERGQLSELWSRAKSGQVVGALVTGEAGIGKSRLVAEVAYRAHHDGAAVLLGVCYEDAPVPFGPFIDAISVHLARLSDHEAARQRAEVDGLDRLLSHPPVRPSGAGGLTDADSEQAQVLATIVGYLSACTPRQPAVLVIEDVHWATASSRDLLRHLARWRGRVPLLIVATSRDTAPDLDDNTRALLGDLERSVNVGAVRLAGLDVVAVAALSASMTGSEPADPEAIRSETGGNPLFVREVAVAASGRTSGASLRALVSRRSTMLDAGDNAVLDVAAVIGADFDARLLAAVTATDVGAILDVLERCESAGLVWSLPGAVGRWGFVHSLFRGVRYDGIGTARRMKLHAAVASVLSTNIDPSDAEVAELARHAYESHLVGDAELAVRACLAAGDRAARLLAVEEAINFYRSALDATSALEPAGGELRCVAAVRLGSMLHNAGDPTGADVLVAAAADARRESNGKALGEIAWALSYYGSGLYGMADDALLEIVDDALSFLGRDDVAERARLLGLRAAQTAFGGDMKPVQVLCDEAVSLARSTGDPIGLAEVLMTIRVAMSTPHNLDQRGVLAEELEAIGEEHGLRLLVLYGRLGRASFLRERGDLAASSKAIDDAAGMLGPTPPVWPSLLSTAMRANRLLFQGDLTGAERVADELLSTDVGTRGGVGVWVKPAAWHPAHLLAIRRYQGRLGEMIDEIERQADVLGPMGEAIRTCAIAHAGRLEHARDQLDAYTTSGLAEFPENLTWLSAMTHLAEAAELTGHQPAARLMAELLAPFAGRLDNFGDGSFGAIDVARVQLAFTMGRDIEQVADDAVHSSRRMDAPVLLGRALVYQAAARTRAGGPATVVESALDEALGIAARTGAALIEHDAARLLGR